MNEKQKTRVMEIQREIEGLEIELNKMIGIKCKCTILNKKCNKHKLTSASSSSTKEGSK